MDLFYYWKNYETDVRAGRIGYLKSDRHKLGELRDRNPDQIWAFKTPTGRKGELQLIASLAWSDTPRVKVPAVEAKSVIYYDPNSANTVFYERTDTDAAVVEISAMLRRQFPTAFRSNFQGDNGLQVIERDLGLKVQKFARGFSGRHILANPA